MALKLSAALSTDAAASLQRFVVGDPAALLPARHAGQASMRALVRVYESVLAAGFSDDAVRSAFEAFQRHGALSSATLDSLLDWLCFQTEFPVPAVFKAHRSGSAAGGVAVLAVQREDFDAGDRDGGDDAEAELLVPLAAVKERHDGSIAATDKAWILSYLDGTTSESSDSEQSADGAVGEAEPSTLLTGQLTEPATARVTLGATFAKAQARARQAKQDKDAAAQREAGQLIREVKQHIARLGLTEEECLAAAPPDEPEELPGSAGNEPPAADDNGGVCDLFDEAAPPIPLPKPSKSRSKVDSKAPPRVRVQPLALLQQHCKSSGWPPPRLERQPTDSRRSYRYTATVERTTAGKKKQVLHCEPPEATYETVEEAQQVAACAALVRVHDQLEADTLAAPYDTLVSSLMEAQAEKPVVEAQKAAISSFLTTLLVAAGSAEASPSKLPSSAGGAPQGPAHRAGDHAAPLQPRLLRQLQALQARDAYKGIAEQRASLPIAAIRTDLAALLYGGGACDAVLVIGETGCGKTTQVPQYVLDDATLHGLECNVIVTQPRRIAAISVAERVAYERMESAPGATPDSVVGYQVRNDAATGRSTRLLFCTMGILLRRLQGDPLLSSVTAVVLDEVHERSLEVDLLLTLLRDLPARRRAAGLPPPKLVLMSATINASMFSSYMHGCPVLTAEGRLFPVTPAYLPDVYEATQYLLPPDSPASFRRGKGRSGPEPGGSRADKAGRLITDGWGDTEADAGPLNPDYDASAYAGFSPQTRVSLSRVNEEMLDFDLLEEVLAYIDGTQGPGAVLVFLSGIREVERLCTRLGATKRFTGCVVLPLHSSLPSADQRAVFRTYGGSRKLVISTNIAETSITIPDVVFVVDSGRQRTKQYDARRGISSLQEEWVSQANAKQRAGRAGRVQAGHYYALYTPARARLFRAAPVPEVQRIPLSEAALHVANLGVGHLHDIFAQMPEPPTAEAVSRALVSLQEAGAMDPDNALTPLGRHLANLPVDISAGKLLIHGIVMGCTRHALTLAAFMGSDRSPFLTDAAERMRIALAAPGADGLAAGQYSDHLVMVDVYEAWRSHDTGAKAAGYCARNGLCPTVLNDISQTRVALACLLAKAGFLPENSWLQAGAAVAMCVVGPTFPNPN